MFWRTNVLKSFKRFLENFKTAILQNMSRILQNMSRRILPINCLDLVKKKKKKLFIIFCKIVLSEKKETEILIHISVYLLPTQSLNIC